MLLTVFRHPKTRETRSPIIVYLELCAVLQISVPANRFDDCLRAVMIATFCHVTGARLELEPNSLRCDRVKPMKESDRVCVATRLIYADTFTQNDDAIR